MASVATRPGADDVSDAPLLDARSLRKCFGGLVALEEVSLTLGRGSVTGVIGPNGAGKSTLIGLLGGALRPDGGAIALEGRDITALPAEERARLGIGRTYQIPRPFLDMTVEENLEVAQAATQRALRGTERRRRRRELLERTGLADVGARGARELPLLRRKRLEVARVLALEPRLVLLDEVGAGLVDSEITELIALIRDVAAGGVTILIVEHVLRLVRECCSSLLVLDFGRSIAAGDPATVLASDDVAAVYLGTAHRAPAPKVTETAERVPGTASPHADLSCLVGDAGPGTTDAPLLRLEGVSASYGQVTVLRDISLSVSRGEVIAVLGANGAGKTSLAHLISGSLSPQSGAMEVDGRDMVGLRPDQVAQLGIAHCMEGRRIFSDLTVEQNLRVAARRVPADEVERRLTAAYGLFPLLRERRLEPGTAMSGGQQQMLAIGRALMSRPRLVVFDEISLGLAPIVMDRLYEALGSLRAAGMTMLIVEQDIGRALDIADRAYVLEHGVVALEGPASTVRADPRLRHLYVGTAD